MHKITDKVQVSRMIFLFMLTYLVSYVTRINYGAVIAKITKAEHIKNSLASLALTGSAVTYGSGQLISGYLGDRIQPKHLVFAGLLTTMATNLLLPACSSVYQMTFLWCINGFAQAFMWPPLVRLMTSLFTKDGYGRACVVVSWGSSFGTVLVYLLSPVCIFFGGWRLVFYVSGACAMVMALVWRFKCPLLEKEKTVMEAKTEEKKQMQGSGTLMLLLGIMAAIVLQGMLRDGVTTWTPSMLSDVFHLSSSTAILTGVVLPLFSVAAFQITSVIYRKFVHNELKLAGLIFTVGFASAFLLAVFGNQNAVFSVAAAALLTGCMHGVNLTLICMVPQHFEGKGKVSFVSGLLNSCTYVGSAVSVYGFARFSEHFGWTGTIWLWSVISLLGTVLCLSLCRKWNTFTEK